jgi:TRAP-type transport system periplasmic protein
MKTKKVALLVIFLVVLLASLSVIVERGESAEKPVLALKDTYNWKMTSFFPSGVKENLALKDFIDIIGKRTDGKVKISLYEGTLGAVTDHWDMLKNNAVQLAFLAESYSGAARMPVGTLSNLCFEVNDLATEQRVYSEWMKAGYLKELTDNMKVAFIKPPYPQTLFTSKKKVTKLEDFKGMKIRSSAALQGQAVTALGAAGVSMPGGEMYMGLQTGVLDGVITGVDNVVDRKLYEPAKFGLKLPIHNGIWVLGINKEVWNGLPKDLQALIDEVAQDVADRDLKKRISEENGYWDTLRQKGMEVYAIGPDELARWKKAVSNVDDKYVQEWSAKGYPVKQALELMRKIAAQK